MLAASLLLKKKVTASGGTAFSPTMKSAGATLSNNNKTATFASTGGPSAFTTNSHSSGKWYFEVLIVQPNGPYTPLIGLASISTTYNQPWTSSGELLWYGSGPQLIFGANSRIGYSSFTTGNVIGVAVDLDAKLLVFYRDGVAMTSVNLTSYVPGVSSFWGCAADPYGSVQSSIVKIPDTFQYMPSGYSVW
ncbi:putative thymidylate kinase [Burkholderia phage FLC6]|nr:putative thymidylate kinase [Burkholderia phage FLC6]